MELLNTFEPQVIFKINLALIMQTIGLFVFVQRDPYIQKRDRKYLKIIVILAGLLIIQNQVEYLIDIRNDLFLRRVISVIGYSVRPVILVLFICIANKEITNHSIWLLPALNTAIHLTAFFSDLPFSYSEQGNFIRGPLGFTCHIISIFLIILATIQSMHKYKASSRMDVVLPIACSVLIIAAIIADLMTESEYTVSYLTITIVNACFFYYIWLHFQFVRAHEQAILAEHRIQIMMSQIQPHFLFNTLSTIQALILIDPDKAFVLLEKFGIYLRENIDSLNQTTLIPFKKELEHTKTYAEIEMTRFPNIQITYDIADDNFQLPALTVQPIVENAIRHGVRIRNHGLVCISVRDEENCHMIVIRDNGKGFDTTIDFENKGTHIGIRNVRERLESLCGGEMNIDSQPGVGTTVTMRVPHK